MTPYEIQLELQQIVRDRERLDKLDPQWVDIEIAAMELEFIE